MDFNDIEKIKKITEEFFGKMTVRAANIECKSSGDDMADLSVSIDEPQMLIGEKGQTLFEIQRILRMVLNKSMQKVFFVNLDINDYKAKKADYLKSIAKDLADEVALTKEEKKMVPMSSYERRIIHAELANRNDVITESAGEGQNRYVVIKPKQ